MRITVDIPFLRDRPLVHAGAVFLGLLILYTSTAPRTVALEDDGLFVMASYFAGIAHPPGYPLFTLIGHLFSYFPLGSVAYRVHLVSAVFGAAACALVWWIVYRTTLNRTAGYLAGLGLGISPIFWSQSIIADVYTLNAFFFFLVFALLVEAREAYSDGRETMLRRTILWASFVYGLSLSNHWPLMLLATPGLLVLAYPIRGLLARQWWRIALVLLAGLTPYAWMVIRSNTDPLVSFQGPIESWGEFWSVVSREAFGNTDRSVSATTGDKVGYIVYTLRLLVEQFLYAGALLGLWGLVELFRAGSRLVAGAIAISLVATCVGLLTGLSFDHDWIFRHVYSVYLLIPLGLVAVLMGAGYAALAKRYVGDRYLGYVSGVVSFALVIALITSFDRNSRSDYAWSKEYANAIFKTIPDNSVVFVSSDIPLGVLGYYHFVEGQRPDVDIYEQHGRVLTNGIVRADQSPSTRRNTRNRFILDTNRPVVFASKYLDPAVDTYSNGLYYMSDNGSGGAPGLDPRLTAYFTSRVGHRDLSDAFTRFHYYALSRRLGETLALSTDQSPIDVPKELTDLVSGNLHLQIGVAQGLITDRRNASAAVELSRELLSEVPDTAPKSYRAALHTSLGWGLVQLGHRDQGIAHLRRSVNMYPRSDNEAIRGLLSIYQQLDMAEAYAELKSRFNVIDVASQRQNDG